MMNPRPAGMSDEEDDVDDFYWSDTDVYDHRSKIHEQKSKDIINYNYTQDREKQQISENHAMNACINGDLDVIQEYLEKYDIDRTLYTGWSLLLHAALSVQLEIIEYLLKHGADPNKDKDGFTPLMALCTSTKELPERSLKCLVLLIEAKADVNATNKYRETPLMHACKSQNVDFVVELLKHVKDINACDNDGKTALSYAVTYNKIDIVAILLKHNADATLLDKYNLTPLDIADAKEYKEISTLLTIEKEEKISYCEISQIITWEDLFPELHPEKRKEVLDHDISYLLYGMGLEKYGILFRGMNLKTFLQLTEDDLCRLGIDLTVYRKQFLEHLHKFHCKKWRVDSIGIVKKSLPYTIFDGVISLANIKNQIGVVASSFHYIKNNLMQCVKEDIILDPAEKVKYEEKLIKTQNTLKILKDEVNRCKKLAQEIDKKNGIGVPANFISPSPKKHRNRISWIIPLSATLIIGVCIYKTTYVYRS